MFNHREPKARHLNGDVVHFAFNASILPYSKVEIGIEGDGINGLVSWEEYKNKGGGGRVSFQKASLNNFGGRPA